MLHHRGHRIRVGPCCFVLGPILRKAPGKRHAHVRRQHLVFAPALLGAAPARIPAQIQDGRKARVDANGAGLARHGSADAAHESSVKGRGEPQGLGEEALLLERADAVQALAQVQNGDWQAGRGEVAALEGVMAGGVEGVSAVVESQFVLLLCSTKYIAGCLQIVNVPDGRVGTEAHSVVCLWGQMVKNLKRQFYANAFLSSAIFCIDTISGHKHTIVSIVSVGSHEVVAKHEMKLENYSDIQLSA